MTDAQIVARYAEMVKEFGSKLPNFEHHPIQFAYYVKLYKFLKGL